MADEYPFANQVEQARQRFEGFREKRKVWRDLLERNLDIELPEEVVKGDDYYQYKSPELEKAAHDWIDIGRTNPTVFDVIPIDQSTEAKQDARSVLMYSAHGWELENEARWWDAAVLEGQVKYGLAVMQHCYWAQKVQDAATAKERRKRQKHPFYWRDCDIFGVGWLGDEAQEGGPSFAFYEAEIPYLEHTKYKKDGMKFGRVGGKHGWYGQDQALDSGSDPQTLKITTIDALSDEPCPMDGCDHCMRKIYVYVCGMDETISEGNLFEEYDSPFDRCSFYVIPGRGSRSRDMDARFRAMLAPMYVEGEATNYLSTLLYAQIREDYGPSGYYIDYAQADPRNVPEGNSVTFDFYGATEGKIQGFPGEVRRMPRTLSPHLPAEIQQHNQRMQDFMPNRFLTGSAYTEASNATGTAFLAQQQQASLPANGLLSQSDAVILKSRKAEYHAIRYWGMAGETEWYAVMSGNNAAVAVKGKQPSHGEVFTVTASMLNELDFDLRIVTKSETLAEKDARYRLARQQWVDGAITPDQFLREAGADDIEGQKMQLRAAETYGLMVPEIQAWKKAAMNKMYQVMTGVDPNLVNPGAATVQQPDNPVNSGGGLGGTTHFMQPGGFQAGQQQNATQDLQQTLVGAGAGNVSGGASPVG